MNGNITWLIHLLGAVLLLIGVGLVVYNALGFRPVPSGFLHWPDDERRLGAAIGAVLLVAGLLLRRVK